MKYNVKTTNIILTPAITDYLDKRLSRLDKFISPEDLQTVMCYVEIGKTTKHHKAGDVFKAELTLHIGGKSLRAVDENDDLYTAIDAVNDRMANDIKSFKNKKFSLIKRGRAKLKSLLKGLYRNKAE